MKKLILTFFVSIVAVNTGRGEGEKPLLLQKPTVSQTHIAFVYAGDLWIVGRDGGDARRLTSGAGVETDPIFSPDGSQILFTGEYDGNVDVYLVPANGGIPRRITYHPGSDAAVGWMPDGKHIVFRSIRDSHSRYTRLFTMPIDGGLPTALPLPMAYDGCFSPDASQLAYVPIPPAFRAWKRYRGGMTTPIWIAKLADSSIERIPRNNSNDFNPMWIANRIYFLSDRNGPVTLYSYDRSSKEARQVIQNDGLDIKSASAGPDAIVYEQFGSIHLLDPQTGKEKKIDIRVAGDFASVRARHESAAKFIRHAGISPTGVRAVFESRGEIITVPAGKGHPRNLTNSPGVADRDPAWSPNGKWIAYFSDEPGEYALHIMDQRGHGPVKKITLGDAPSYYYTPVWSPDSKKIAYTDKRLKLWYVDIDTGKSKHVDTDTYESPMRSLYGVWSPDNRWLAYTKSLKNHLRAVFLYNLDTGKTHQITDGMSDAQFPDFDKNGKYLYFTASTDAGPTTGWLDMSSMNRLVSRHVYVVVLNKTLPSPIAPESDEEPSAETPKTPLGVPPETKKQPGKSKSKEKSASANKEKKPEKEKKAAAVKIDLENIDQRILALPIPARNFVGLAAGKAGTIFLLDSSSMPRFTAGGLTLSKFDLTSRQFSRTLDGLTQFDLSHNGEKMLYQQGGRWFITAAGMPATPGSGAIKVDEMEVYIDPKAEWKQMYREVWRIERDFLYDPGYHGLDLKAAESKYAPYVEQIVSRSDLNYLFQEMLGELSIGHLYVVGGDIPQVKPVRGGLLGADYRIDKDRYQFAHVYHGENWNPQYRAPLTQPGVNVKAGEYLLAVNGRDLRSTDNIYRLFVATAGKSVVLKVGPKPDGSGSREVTVTPIESEVTLRYLAWIDENRRQVDKMSGGRLAYVYLPDTSVGGYTNFNRYYFAQIGKEGAVIDERFNGGGTAADYIVDYMRRPLMNYWSTREGEDFTTPVGSIFGPKAMIINEFAGSGGDALPWYFRKAKIGPLIGKRTWGGLVGIYDYPPLIDGGMVTAPRVAFWKPEGSWEVENHGVGPDIEVEFDPKAVRAGHDPQLEKAVQVVLAELKKNPLPRAKKPAYPNYHKGNGASAKTGIKRNGSVKQE